MRAWTIPAAAVAAGLAIVAAGCAGAGGPGGASTLGGAASVAPSSSVAFVSLDTNLSSSQWQTVDGLLSRFPSHDELLTQLRRSFEQHAHVSWNDDVKPALGSELDLAVLPGAKAQVVGLAQPADTAKFDALLAKLGRAVVSTEVGGWTVFSEDAAALDAVKNATAHLADDNVYREATAKLAADALVHAYANGAAAQQLLGSFATPAKTTSAPNVPFEWAAADVVASDGGLRVDGYARDSARGATQSELQQATPTAPYAARLPDEIPAGALFVADFRTQAGAFDAADAQRLPEPLKRIFAGTSSLIPQLDAIFGGETGVYVRPGLPIPEVTLVTSPSDTGAAESALPDVVSALRGSLGPAKTGGFDLSQLPVYHAVIGGQLVVSTSQQGIADFRSGGAKLSSDAAFRAALHASAMPNRTTGFVYANLKAALPLVQALGPMAGLKAPATGLDPLRTLTAYGNRQGDESSFTVFLELASS